jgi:lipopolysaccharide export system protein LptA
MATWDGTARWHLLTRHVLCLCAAAIAVFWLQTVGAGAQTPVSGFSGLTGANSKKPIDIESDRLEVDDKRHIAIFIGGVSATQGDYNLKAPRLEVTYESAPQPNEAGKPPAQAAKNAKPTKAASAGASGDPFSSGQIKFIHALGGTVVITSKKDQQEATGDDAIYDVKAQKVTISGRKVVLTQKKNVVEGRKLLIDLATGQATVIPDGDTAEGIAALHKGRVRAVLQQEGGNPAAGLNPFGQAPKKDDPASQKPGAQAPKAAPSQQAAPASGWQTQGR